MFLVQRLPISDSVVVVVNGRKHDCAPFSLPADGKRLGYVLDEKTKEEPIVYGDTTPDAQ